jgi:Domain of unknown function (DUF4221)
MMKKSLKATYSCFLLVLLFSCSEEVNVTKPTFASSESFRVPAVLTFKWFSTYCDSEHTYCIYYTNVANQFIGFDLNKKSLEIKFKLPETLAQSENIGSFRGFYIHNFDSIFLLHDYRISIIDTSENIKYTKIINSPESEELPDTIYGNFGGNFPLSYSAKTRTLFCMQYSGRSSVRELKFYQLPIEASLSLSDSVFKSIPVNYPKIYTTGFYGEATDAFRLVNGNLHIYSFNADPNVYTYDIVSEKKMVYECKSAFDKNSIKQIGEDVKEDMNKKMDHLINSPLYLNMLYDKYRNCYYRFFYKPLPVKNEDGSYNSFESKELSCVVLDKDFNKIKEYDIGGKYLWYYSIVSNKGLYLYKKPLENAEKRIFTEFQYDILRIN